jgi:hypothetical protein
VARQLEPVVPPALAALLRRDPAETVRFTVLVITTDPAGWPALAMVSAGELAVDARDRLAPAQSKDGNSVRASLPRALRGRSATTTRCRGRL